MGILALPNELLLDIADCLPRSDQFFLRVNKRLSKLLAERVWKFPIKPIRADCWYTSILVWAASKGNHYVIARLLERGVDLNKDPENDYRSGMAIFEAASEGHGRVVKQLLVGGANLDARYKYGVHVFSHMAVYTDKHLILDMLLSGDPDIKNNPTKHLQNMHKAMHYMFQRHRRCLNHSRIKRNLIVLLENSANIDAFIDDQHETILHRAVIEGRENFVRLILDCGASTSVKDSTGKTPLYRAVEQLSGPIVRLLVGRGADIKTSSADGSTVLHMAVEKKSSSMVKLLIRLGISLNVKDGQGNTPLHRAAELGLDEIVEELLWIKLESVAANKLSASDQEMARLLPPPSTVKLMCRNTDINTTDTAGRTPLHVAGSATTAEKLLENDADVNATDTAGQTALHVAADRGSTTTAKILLRKGANVNVTDKAGQTALYIVTRRGFDDMARLFIAGGSDIKSAYQNRWVNDDLPWGEYTASAIAVCTGLDGMVESPLKNAGQQDLRVARLLIASGATLDLIYEERYHFTDRVWLRCTALTIAVHDGFDSMVELLLKHGAVPGQHDLHMAVKQGYYSTVKLLLEGGADINRTDKDGRTALVIAVRSGHDDMARLLIASGATLDLIYVERYHFTDRMWFRCTALTIAVHDGFDSMVELLLKHGAVLRQEDLHVAVIRGYYSTVKLLLEWFTDINGTDEVGRKVLDAVVWSGYDKMIIELFLEHGAAPDNRALQIAVKYDCHSTVKLLLGAGADINESAYDGRSALHVAVYSGCYDMAALLIDSGSDINETYQEIGRYLPAGKYNALTIAVYAGFEGMVKLLLKHGASPDRPDGFTQYIDIAARQGFHNIVKLLRGLKYSIQE